MLKKWSNVTPTDKYRAYPLQTPTCPGASTLCCSAALPRVLRTSAASHAYYSMSSSSTAAVSILGAVSRKHLSLFAMMVSICV